MYKVFFISMTILCLWSVCFFVALTAQAADGSVTTPLLLCSYLPKDKPQCATSRTAKMTVPQSGTYRFEVVVTRGNHMECQDQESFYMTINGQRTPIIADPGPCEAQGTVTRTACCWYISLACRQTQLLCSMPTHLNRQRV